MVVEAEVEVLLAYRELPSNRDVVLYNQQGHFGSCKESRRRGRRKEKKKQENKLQIDSEKSEFGFVFGVAILRGSM